MAREALQRGLLAALALLILAASGEAQRGKGKGKGKGATPPAPAPVAPQPAKPGKSDVPPLTLPGYRPDAAKPEGSPGAPANKGPAAKPAPEKPRDPALDPMTAADLVTGAADHLERQAASELRRLREHFAVCDIDQNGWLSLREAEVTLSLSRDEFRRTDANQDGRADMAEFEAQKGFLLARMGAASPVAEDDERVEASPPLGPENAPVPDEPAPQVVADAPPPPKPRSQFDTLLVRPGDLLKRYDLDNSKGISAEEIAKLFNEIGLEYSPEMAVAQMDPNHSGELQIRELKPLAWLTSKHLPKALRPGLAATSAAPAAATEGASPHGSPDEGEAKAGPEPEPLAPTVATHFGRLDPDHDGAIGESDLRALQGNARLEVRLRAVLSAMDADGDGRLSREEFDASMRR